jgi:hypothetical protein
VAKILIVMLASHHRSSGAPGRAGRPARSLRGPVGTVPSGQAEHVRAAMKAAIEMVARFARPPQKQGRPTPWGGAGREGKPG